MTRQRTRHLKSGLLTTALLLAPGFVAAGAVEPPRLILQITVDAVRGDLPGRYSLLFGDSDDREYETDFPGFGRTFPHPYGAADDKYFTTRLTLSPAGYELTLDFAKALIDNEQLGQDAVPGRLHELGIEHARHFDTDALDKAPAIAALKEQLGVGEGLIEADNKPDKEASNEITHQPAHRSRRHPRGRNDDRDGKDVAMDNVSNKPALRQGSTQRGRAELLPKQQSGVAVLDVP